MGRASTRPTIPKRDFKKGTFYFEKFKSYLTIILSADNFDLFH